MCVYYVWILHITVAMVWMATQCIQKYEGTVYMHNDFNVMNVYIIKKHRESASR